MSEATTTTANTGLYGLLAEFDRDDVLVEAARKIHEAGYRRIDAYSPFPVHGLAEAMGRRRTLVPLIVLLGGLSGGLTGFFGQVYSAVINYPINIGGRPLYSWPSFIPITFELTVLGASVCGVIGMIALNGLPEPYHPVFNVKRFERASTNGFFLLIETADPRFDPQATRRDLEALNPRAVHDVPP